MAKKSKKPPKTQVLGFVGIGLDAGDDEKRVTTTEHFLLIGGSQETHERMQETAIRFNEGLQRRGKQLKDASVDEVVDLFHQANR